MNSRRHFIKLGTAALLLPQFSRAEDAKSVPKLTMLNSMAGSDFEKSCKRHVELGIKGLDIKEGLWGQNINNVSLENAQRAADIAKANGLAIYNLSTQLCHSDLNAGEAAYRKQHLTTLEHVLKVAAILKPDSIRLISASLKPFPKGQPVMDLVEKDFPWVFAVYQEMIDHIVESGHRVLIENETPDVIFNDPNGIVRFFQRLDRADKVRYTWDVQNLWQMGVFPTTEVYQKLRPLMGCIHLKGGRSEDGKVLKWASSLEDASWPVLEIVRAVVADGAVSVICLNSSHGEKPPGYDSKSELEKDIAFLRKNISQNL